MRPRVTPPKRGGPPKGGPLRLKRGVPRTRPREEILAGSVKVGGRGTRTRTGRKPATAILGRVSHPGISTLRPAATVSGADLHPSADSVPILRRTLTSVRPIDTFAVVNYIYIRPSVGQVVQDARRKAGLRMKDLGVRAQISGAQISRIEAGITERPSRNTLIALARALDRDPTPLLVIADHLTSEEARSALGGKLRDGAELVEEWNYWDEDVSAARSVLDDPEAPADQIKAIAAQIFATPETEETLWHDAYIGMAAKSEDAHELRELVQQWPYLTPQRRSKVLDFARDQADLARRESTDEMREDLPDYGRA